MRAYTTAYVESCTHCRASKSLNKKPAGLLQQLLIPSRRWADVSLDFTTDLPLKTTGHDSILVMVGSLSKMAHFVSAKRSITAADTVELLADRDHGFPEVLISDRDPRFQSDLWQQLCSRFNIKRCMSSSYHPQSDGQTKRVNRTLEHMLRTSIQSDEREWERLLPALELAHNTTSHSATELSPFGVIIGENPLTSANLDIVGALAPTLTPPMTELFRQLCDRAQSQIQKAKWQQKYYADTKRQAMEYAVGDKVWLSSKHLPASSSCPKFEPRYRGPFKIIERIGTVACCLALPPTYEYHNVFHVPELVPHRPRPPDLVPQEADTAWPPILDEAGNPTEEYGAIILWTNAAQVPTPSTSSSGAAPPKIKPSGSPLTTYQDVRLCFALGAAANEDVFRLETILVLPRRSGVGPSTSATRRSSITRGVRKRCVPHALTALASEGNED
ncbi:Similar to Transposon MAGGYgagandpolgenehomologues, related [Eimeria necatrix]|uniref:Similar to Transposon MAGGYgagandpolgenehomologues, related n=1 Tax=Eimeria necatrix TaxID=51315 RepID=U6MLT9_9EIME|nr:Similar to Transposon MAGGYgagandpolgenehomologues, related [Eimeria necatrix]CDJ62605.1 Similar to Transposon MAGGYgagandpolgenehomologues, related [Eimeria necatrix]